MLQVAKMAFRARETASRWLNASALAVLTITAISYPCVASGEEVTLKLSFITSDRSANYQCYVKPFVDAVNADGAGLVHIKVYFSGAISPAMPEQARLVLAGTADLAYVVPGYSPQQFPDISVLELPGLFRNEREASLVFARLAAVGALKGYRKFFLVGAFVTEGESIHSRKPIATLADLKGQRIRVNNQVEAETLRKLGAVPTLLPINRAMEALSQGKLDGVTVPKSMLTEFGFGRLTNNHYLVPLGGALVSLVMNREKLASLPLPAQEIIVKYSGKWLSEQGASCFEAKNREMLERLNADRRRTVVAPSSADLAAAQKVFSSVVDAWAAQSPRHRELLALVRAELRKLRSPKETHP